MRTKNNDRRLFLKQGALTMGALIAGVGTGVLHAAPHKKKRLYNLSLAQWSLHRTFRAGKADPLDFARISREKFGIANIEYVNQFYFDSLNDKLIKELKNRADGEGVNSLLIMCDREGAIGDPDKKARAKAVNNHHRWANAARALGCHSIRVNAQSSGTWEEQKKYSADGLNKLAEYCGKLDINVIVENHGGLSSNGKWLAEVMRLANNPRVGTLPDFGNFVINRETGEQYDKYRGVQELMAFAKAVSAKAFRFDKKGNEPDIDFSRMMKIVVDSGFNGYVGIEYEGDSKDEYKGIQQTRDLLEKVHSKLIA